MGWSPWIQAPAYEFLSTRTELLPHVVKEYFSDPDGVHGPYDGYVSIKAAADAMLPALRAGAERVFGSGLSSVQMDKHLVTSPSWTRQLTHVVVELSQAYYTFDCTPGWLGSVGGWSGYQGDRDTFPDALAALTEGIDYSVIPGTTDYVEYESGDPNALLGWVDWNAPVLYGEPYAADALHQVVPHRFGALLPALDLSAYNENTVPWKGFAAYGAGMSLVVDVLGQTPAADDSEGPVTVPLGALGTTLTWTMLLQPNTLGPLDPLTVEMAMGTSANFSYQMELGPSTRPRMAFRMPRYRYWQPRAAYRRQVQRNDGLGRSVTRARSTSSVQKSNRARGYS